MQLQLFMSILLTHLNPFRTNLKYLHGSEKCLGGFQFKLVGKHRCLTYSCQLPAPRLGPDWACVSPYGLTWVSDWDLRWVQMGHFMSNPHAPPEFSYMGWKWDLNGPLVGSSWANYKQGHSNPTSKPYRKTKVVPTWFRHKIAHLGTT